MRVTTRIIGGALVSVLLATHAAQAQATTYVTPSVAVSATYDENILWRPDASSDHVWTAEPACQIVRESPRSRLWFDAASNTAWYDRYRDLTSIFARQHVNTDWSWRPSSVSTLNVLASYDSSTDPSDIDPATGLTLGRLRTWHWAIAPEYVRSLSSRLKISARVRSRGQLAEVVPSIFTQSAEAEVAWASTERHEIRAGAGVDVYALDTGTLISIRPSVHWVYRVTPLTRVMAGGGVQLHDGAAQPTIDLAIARRTSHAEAALSYERVQSPTLGIGELVDVQRVLGTLYFGRPGTTTGSLRVGGYRTQFGTEDVRVLLAGVDIQRPVRGPVAIGASYSIGFDDDGLGQPRGPLGATPAVISNTARRQVLSVRLIVTGPQFAMLKRAEQPTDIVRDPHREGRP